MERKDEKRVMLLEAACNVLARFGFRKTTLEDIAAEASVGRATIYYYFKSKEEIFSAVVRHESEVLLDAIHQAVAQADSPKERFIAFVKARYQHLRKLKTLHSITQDVARELLPLAEAERERFFVGELDMLKEILQFGIDEGTFRVREVELFALAAIAGLRGLDSTFMTYGKHDRIEEGIEGLLDVIIYGLEAR